LNSASSEDLQRNEARNWWRRRRRRYNLGLVVAGVLAFASYAWIFEARVIPRCVREGRTDCEITLFTIFFQGCGYLVAMGVANLFYSFGAPAELLLHPADPPRFRQTVYGLGFAFSLLLPFSVPVLLWTVSR
jgi:hypothetical protein